MPISVSVEVFIISGLMTANDFGFSFNCTKGNIKSGTVFWKEGMREVWTNGFFKLNACNFCDDIFAELADVVFMDAWIDPYIYDSKGTNTGF